MKQQIKCHNEVMLFGRIMSRGKSYKVNNRSAIKVKLAMPNDDNYELNPNIAYIYVYDDGNIYNSLKENQTIGINGHIESKWGQRIIADVICFIKEAIK